MKTELKHERYGRERGHGPAAGFWAAQRKEKGEGNWPKREGKKSEGLGWPESGREGKELVFHFESDSNISIQIQIQRIQI